MSSSAAGVAHLHLRIPCATKLARAGEIASRQPMTSLFEQALLVICDLISLLICSQKGLELAGLWHAHANLE
jgi:6-phospho-3-hexuloisomerase